MKNLKKYIPEITKYATTNPMIPPYEWKQCVLRNNIKISRISRS